MKRSHAILSVIALTALGSTAALAQGQGGGAPPVQHPMTFFVTSAAPGTGKLGGLAGADKICQDLAAAAGAGGHTWHAYMSQEAQGGMPVINARDRIGPGPWYNSKNTIIANNVDELHGDTQRDRNNIKKMTSLTEKGDIVNGFGDMPNEHDMLTGSDSDGRAFTDGMDHTCHNWTSDGTDGKTMLGHSDRNGGNNASWNAAHMSIDCTVAGLKRTGSAGRFYCFATN
jgi:hypothetical protein